MHLNLQQTGAHPQGTSCNDQNTPKRPTSSSACVSEAKALTPTTTATPYSRVFLMWRSRLEHPASTRPTSSGVTQDTHSCYEIRAPRHTPERKKDCPARHNIQGTMHRTCSHTTAACVHMLGSWGAHARTCGVCMGQWCACHHRGPSTMHLQGTHSGHNDGTVRGEAAGAALDVHKLLQPDVSAKASLVTTHCGWEEAGKHTYIQHWCL